MIPSLPKLSKLYWPLAERENPEEGQFGYKAAYRCEFCGPISEEPIYYQTARQTIEFPAEGGSYCAVCGGDGIAHKNRDRAWAHVVRRHLVFRLMGGVA